MMDITRNYTEFIKEPTRARSREVDFGVWWSDRIGPDGNRKGPFWRVSWLEATGELYAVSMGTKLVILGTYPDRMEVEKAMRGWENPNNPDYMDLRALVDRLK